MSDVRSPRRFDPSAEGWTMARSPSFLTSIADVWHRDTDGQPSIGFFCEPRHDNGSGKMHGGLLMTLADMGLGILVRHHRSRDPETGGRALFSPTIQLEVHFMGGVDMGDFVHSRAEISRMTRTLTFARGTLRVGDAAVVSMQGIFKVVRPSGAD